MVLDAIYREAHKMLEDNIIYPIYHSTWIANIVLVRNKNGEIRICVGFRNLNQTSLNDNYALPKMDHLSLIVVGPRMMCI